MVHHGNKTSTSQQLPVAVEPDVTVISVDTDNPFGHSSLEVVARLIHRLGEDNVYRTDEDGTIESIADREEL